jgi:hypothetical protein
MLTKSRYRCLDPDLEGLAESDRIASLPTKQKSQIYALINLQLLRCLRAELFDENYALVPRRTRRSHHMLARVRLFVWRLVYIFKL